MIRRKARPKIVAHSLASFKMPFTPAHPAILLALKPFKSIRFSWTALIIGSIIPDFEYFIWMSPSAFVSHTVLGILSFNLPMTFVMAFVWHQLLFPVLIPRLPFFHQRIQLEEQPAFMVWIKKNWVLFIVSALMGILSHLVWDSFSHGNGYLVNRIPYLNELIHLGSFSLRRCYLFWYMSTLLGMAILFYWYIDLKKIGSISFWRCFFQGESFWSKILFIAGLICTTRIYFGLAWNWSRHFIMILIGSIFYSLLIVSWLELKKTRKYQA